MGKLISIDPGYKACGIAYFIDGNLEAASLVSVPSSSSIDPTEQFAKVGEAVADYVRSVGVGKSFDLAIEYPQQYARSPAPRESVQKLVGVIGSISSALQAQTGGLSVKVTSYTPQSWKGQVPKEIMNNRVLGRLLETELSCLPEYSKSKMHNVLDAIGIGLKHLKRLELKRA